MNRILRERYPVSRLPEDLRREFPEQSEVTLIVDDGVEASVSARDDEEEVLAEIRRTGVRGGDFSRFKHLKRTHFADDQEIAEYISELRAE